MTEPWFRHWRGLVVALGATALIWAAWLSLRPRHTDCHFASGCTVHVRDLTQLLMERGLREGWPPYGGKNFVLSLVAYGDVPLRAELVEVFGCPEDDFAPAPEARWREVTLAALAERRFPELTTFAGRRNDEPAYRLAEGAEKTDEPILAATWGRRRFVVIGFANGAVRTFQLTDLGLPEGMPIRFGEDAEIPLLRKLSDR